MTVFHIDKFWTSDDPLARFEATLANLSEAIEAGVAPTKLPKLCIETAATSLALVSIDGCPPDIIWENAEWSNFNMIGLTRDQGLRSVAAAMSRINRDDDHRALVEAATAKDETALFAGYPENFTVLSERDEIAAALGALLVSEIKFVPTSRDKLDAQWADLAQNA